MTLAWDAEGCCLREGRTKLSPGRWAGSLEGELVGRAEALTSPTSLFGLDSAWAVGLLVSGSSKAHGVPWQHGHLCLLGSVPVLPTCPLWDYVFYSPGPWSCHA